MTNNRITVGEYTYGANNIILGSWGGDENITVSIGKYCSIADDVTILISGEHQTNWITTYPFHAFNGKYKEHIKGNKSSKGNITIGSDVWICVGVKILSGITIGDGAILGAYSIITKNVPPYAIVGGNPAQIIRHRFGEENIKKLLEIKWWDKEPEEIDKLMPYLLSDNVEEFIKGEI
jgi:acetyltransferase-like isoleucine patch superfamily enzyme